MRNFGIFSFLLWCAMLVATLLLVHGCAWQPVNLYDTPAHIACAQLHDGIQSDSCHVAVYRDGDLTSTHIAKEIAQSQAFTGGE